MESEKELLFDKTFSEVIESVQFGFRAQREGWNGKDMFIALSPGCDALPSDKFWSAANRRYAEENGGSVKVLPCFTMKTATGEILMGWLASQTDMLATDWRIFY